ncbi:hypothetical protein, partial [Burkholderia gladioli]|uniref:hypothetical protein n=1 Tax=Burkholderia gladioli TaxID=28095 RepID=UPI00164205BC
RGLRERRRRIGLSRLARCVFGGCRAIRCRLPGGGFARLAFGGGLLERGFGCLAISGGLLGGNFARFTLGSGL